MATDTIVQCKGLVTQYNTYNQAPGALAQADDCIIRRENVIENRRGMSVYGALASDGKQILVYMKRLIAHFGSTLAYDNGSGTFTNYTGSFVAPPGEKLRGVEASQNLYVTTSLGVKVLAALSPASTRASGSPRALDVDLSTTGSTGFLSSAQNVAYRTLIKRTDANNNAIFGYPSNRSRVYNAAGAARNVQVTAYIPSEVTTADVVQVYRTSQVAASSSTDDTAGDEMALVFQVSPSATDVTNGYVQFTDSITDALRGASLYTSPSQETISQANDRPPLCKDVALYKSDYVFYANTSTKQRLFLSLVGTSGLSGQSITLGGVTYNFGATEITSGGGSPQVLVSSTGVAAVDIDLTARSLVRVINRYALNTSVYAYYQSGSNDLPGQVMIEERGIGGSAFTVQSSTTGIAAMFQPQPPVSPGTNTFSTSTNDIGKNRLYFSKSKQGEHVPALNYIFAGPSNAEILRIAALRDSLIVISEAGVFRATGDSPQNFYVEPLDLTVICKAKDSVVVLANQVFMLSNQGVVSISDTGVQVVSREIEPELAPLLTFPSLHSVASATAYESDRCFILSVPKTSSDTTGVQSFVFNAFTRCWSRYTFGFAAAAVEPSSDRLFLSRSGESRILRERKDFLDTDYADPESLVTVTALGSTVTFTSAGVTPRVGDVLSQGSSTLPIMALTDAGGGSYVATVGYAIPASWALGGASLVPAIPFSIRWAPWTASQPAIMKHVRQVSILTDSASTYNTTSLLYATFATDLDPVMSSVAIVNTSSRWGSKPWGTAPWGGRADTFAYPTYLPMNQNYARTFTVGVKHSRAQEKISISGVSYVFDGVSERTSR